MDLTLSDVLLAEATADDDVMTITETNNDGVAEMVFEDLDADRLMIDVGPDSTFIGTTEPAGTYFDNGDAAIIAAKTLDAVGAKMFPGVIPEAELYAVGGACSPMLNALDEVGVPNDSRALAIVGLTIIGMAVGRAKGVTNFAEALAWALSCGKSCGFDPKRFVETI